MKIQEVSKDFTEGGIMFSNFKTSYIEENTSKGEENIISASTIALKHPGASDGVLGAQKEDKRSHAHDVGRLVHGDLRKRSLFEFFTPRCPCF